MVDPATAPRRLGGAAAYVSYRAGAAVLRSLPWPVATGGSRLLAAAVAAVPGSATDLYVRHVQRVLGHPLTRSEQRRWARRALSSYFTYWIEGARLPGLPAAVVQERMRMESGFEHLEQAVRDGRGAIVALPHVGSWEWGGAWLSLQGYPMTAVVEPLQPPQLFQWFVAQRLALGMSVVPLGPEAGPAVLRTLRAGGVVALVCDRDLTGKGVPVELFGEKTTLPAGPATLALRTGAALLPAAVYSGPGPMHTAVVRPPLETVRAGTLRADVQRLTQDLAHALEALIRRAPEQWHLFQPNWPSDPGSPHPPTEAGTSLTATS